MVSVHQDLMTRVGCPPQRALMLDTPYGFEENAPGITSKTQNYFSVNVGHPIDNISVADFTSADPLAVARLGNGLRDSRYIFAGPGSPSYALRQWRTSVVPALLSARLREGGCVTFASAAATTLGRHALPVYEIYKSGEPPHWLEGLSIMDDLGLAVAVIPHYDNAQGGTHDTRYCFMGERRLLELERQLEPGVAVLGVAEHTAAILDRDADSMTVRGRGFAAIRRDGIETIFKAGETVPLDVLRGQKSGLVQVAAAVATSVKTVSETDATAARDQFEEALQRDDTAQALTLLLEMEGRIAEQLAEAGAADGRDEFRGMLVRLGEAVDRGLRDPRESIGPFVDLAVSLRDAARRERRFADADLVRDHLLSLGIEIQDTPDGTQWTM
jgi:hypothetical protein